MRSPKVSIIIPTYNVERFLAENLDAVLAQDFTDFEVLIGDNCSTDGTFALIQSYAARDPRIRCWQNQSNLGGVGNFNECLKAVQGEYVKLLCSDDKLLDPSALRKMVAQLDQNPSVALVSCASWMIDEQSRPFKFRNHFGKTGVWSGREIIIRCFETPANIVGEPTLIMYRQAFWQQSFNPQFNQLADLEFSFHLLERGDFAYIAEPLAAWRRRGGQETEVNQRAGRTARDELNLIQDWYARPWLQERATRQLLFTQIHHLRKCCGRAADAFTADLETRLGKGWYAVYALKRKISRPLIKISRQLKARFPAASPPKTIQPIRGSTPEP